MRTLFSWMGNTDLRAVDGDPSAGDGPILSALKDGSFDTAVLLSDFPNSSTTKLSAWLQARSPIRISTESVKLRSPTNFEDIYRAARTAVSDHLSRHSGSKLTFHLSPGTPAMAAVWILIAKTQFPAHLIESSREQGVRTVAFPFDLAAEFTPGSKDRADKQLEQLSASPPPSSPEFDEIIHRSTEMKRAVARARLLAVRDVPVLIQGESGTGKELFARAIHRASVRASKPFQAVNCGAIPPELVDSTLFGHEKGAFTGAVSSRAGYFEAADGGTLFLDEIGELPLASQVRLLRVLQEREVTRVGATQSRAVNVRVIAATNRVLPIEVQTGRFREDLFHRLAVGVLLLPPLRSREGDLGLLIDTLLERINEDAGSQPNFEHKKLSVSARNVLLRQARPGNVRELHNTLLRAAVWASGKEITKADIEEALALGIPAKPEAVLGQPLGSGLNIQDILAGVARHYLTRAMSETHGNKTEAANLLGLPSYQTLSNWLKKFGVPS